MAQYELHATTRFTSEVLVVGDGLAGACAALEASAQGRRVLLTAPGPAPAAELTQALHGVAAASDDPHLEALRQRVATLGGVHGDWLDPDLGQLALDRMFSEAGVEVLLYATPLAVLGDDGRATGVLMGGKDGLYVIAAGAVVEATEDGVLFANAGVPMVEPETVTACRHLFFQLAGSDLSRLPAQISGFPLQARLTWENQVCVTLTGTAAYDGGPVPAALHQASLLAEEAVAAACLAAVPGLQDALVSHSSYRLLPLSGPRLVTPQAQHPALVNVVGAGAWVTGEGYGNLAALAAAGTAAGKLVAAQCLELVPEPSLMEALDLPQESCDVAVLGGGTGGPLAAWAAARGGAETVIYEAGWTLGGIPTSGGINSYYHGVPGGLQDDLDRETDRLADTFGGRQRVGGFHPEARKLVLEQRLGEVGAEVRYGWTAADVVMAGDRVGAVLLVTPGQMLLARPQVAIDATGDGDLAAAAGAPVMYGREPDGLSHQYSQSAMRFHEGGLWHYNYDAGYVDGRSVADLTRARRVALQQYWPETSFTAENRPFNIAYLLGLRQSRHLVGDYVLTLDDQVTNRHFPDVVAYGRCHQDNHAFDYENEDDDAMLWCWTLGFWKRMMHHEVPYRCLVPQGLSNVLLACRAVSVTREAHMLLRMIRDVYRLGEAAGTAAALALACDGRVRDISVAELQAKLIETGALLADWPAPEEVPAPTELVASLADPTPSVAVWHLYQQGEAALPALQAGLNSADEHQRWWCAVALAMIGSPLAAPLLQEVLVARDRRRPSTNPQELPVYLKRMAPRWVSAAVLLGRLGDRGAVPALLAVLGETVEEVDWLLAAVRSLGRIGDPRAAEALREFVSRADLPTASEFQDSHGRRLHLARDLSWQIRLATAEALARVGAPAPDLIAPYLEDQRAWVREYAVKVSLLVPDPSQ